MTVLTKYYNTGDVQKFFDDIDRYSLGMDEWFRNFPTVVNSVPNYPPYNIVKESDTDLRLEIALAGFNRNEITVYTEFNKLVVEGNKEVNDEKQYVHRGLATRTFSRSWNMNEALEVKEVSFNDGLLVIRMSKIIPDHQRKKVWFGTN